MMYVTYVLLTVAEILKAFWAFLGIATTNTTPFTAEPMRTALA
jgi:hypothetical protein